MAAGQEPERICILVSHTHWDREWYRPFEGFRARLVDTIDVVLDQLATDPGWAFLLDGQTIVLEDYLAVRPSRRAELEAACRAGRLAIGPWYVQPDSLLPSGEAHVRNLIEGRRVGEEVGPVSRVGYTPDSFGHPAQLPQLFAGFGIDTFVYWRGNGSELDRLGPVWRWEAPDGTSVTACHLGEGYFPAAYLGDDVDAAADRLQTLADKLGGRTVLLMNGLDHAPPDARTAEVCRALAARTGWEVRRGLLEDYVSRVPEPAACFTGELVGGRVANLLPGVWSTRLYLKQRNRRAEAVLERWAEPWAALARLVGVPLDERPSIRTAWRALLANQAHDSICGCSTDRVHEQMLARYDTAEGLADETTSRLLERVAGLGVDRHRGWDVAVFNPSPHPRTDVVRYPLDAHPLFMIGNAGDEIHQLLLASMGDGGITVDGNPARIVVPADTGRVRMVPDKPAWDVEFVAADVPAFGWRRYRLAPGPRAESAEDGGVRIAAGELSVEAADDGTLNLTRGDRTWTGLFGLEDTGDRGDTYDYDPDPSYVAPPALPLGTSRRTHPDGVQELVTRRLLGDLPVMTIARLVPGTGRVDVEVTVDNTRPDHRLRLLFPVGAGEVRAATTFDAVTRRPGPADDTGWMHAAPRTFPHQGWLEAAGLVIGAPDLPEAELTPDGTLAITLVRAVGWLSGMALTTRPLPAGPGMPTPGAQCLGVFSTTITLGGVAEPALRAVGAGPAPHWEAGRPLLSLHPASLVLSALKPAERGDGLVARVLNPGDTAETATLTFGVPVSAAEPVRLDEERVDGDVRVDGATVTFPVPAHALRSVRISR